VYLFKNTDKNAHTCCFYIKLIFL